eukprot:NODE_290_length_10614_cov_1.553590.p10 type:complete len:150 gc:universal NODE_290_length_10614_cov_1.553590:6277-5828(-)
MNIIFTPEHGYVLLTATAMGFHCYLQGFQIGQLRKAYGLTYPDMGDGRYSKKLTDEQWFKFACTQRAHLNYLEALPMFLTFMIIGGIAYPTIATGLGITGIVGRQFYAMGYRSSGPKGRSIGAGISALAIIGLFGLAITTGLKVSKFIQ